MQAATVCVVTDGRMPMDGAAARSGGSGASTPDSSGRREEHRRRRAGRRRAAKRGEDAYAVDDEAAEMEKIVDAAL